MCETGPVYRGSEDIFALKILIIGWGFFETHISGQPLKH